MSVEPTLTLRESPALYGGDVSSSPANLPQTVLVHGEANSAGVWSFWQRELAGLGWTSHAVELRGRGASPGDLAATSMRDYADDVVAALRDAGEGPVVVGWSMGGLVAMMAAAGCHASACVCLAPSMPARETDASLPLRRAVFGPEEYGITSRDPADQPTMPDLDAEEREVALASLANGSRLARDERRAGVVVSSLACPLLIVTGTRDDQWPRSAYDGLWLNARHFEAEGASHWGLVLNRRVLETLVPRVMASLVGE